MIHVIQVRLIGERREDLEAATQLLRDGVGAARVALSLPDLWRRAAP